jgi:hypothetical protein
VIDFPKPGGRLLPQKCNFATEPIVIVVRHQFTDEEVYLNWLRVLGISLTS